jgi:site-specific recombinase XerD
MITKCEKIYAALNPFDYQKFRELLWAKEKYDPTTLLIKDLFALYIDEKPIKPGTKDHMNYSCRAWCKTKKELSILDITPEFVDKFEREQLASGNKLGTVNSFHRDLRSVINYAIYKKKLVPQSYVYPYGKGGHTIKSSNPKKDVFKQEEIQKIIDYEDFDSAEQRYARDIWATLYYCNGSNFADLLRLRWDNRVGGHITYIRKKTETTRKNFIQDGVIPISNELQNLFDTIGDETSPFILGELKEGYDEITFKNKCHKMKVKINQDLHILGKKLGLRATLNLKTARECYASTLNRKGISREKISEMMLHANISTTNHYLASMDMEETDEINSVLVKKSTPETTPENRKTGENQ